MLRDALIGFCWFALLVLTESIAWSGETTANWSARELNILRSIAIDGKEERPASPSNRYADSVAAAALGKMLFFDKRPSENQAISCASCHVPDQYFTDGRKHAVGVREAMRNSPTIVGTAHNRWFYWDGRRDSLWSQALIPFEAANEMGGNRLAVVKLINSDKTYRELYEDVFKSVPDDVGLENMPNNAGPFAGDDARLAWAQLKSRDQAAINRIYSNVGKAIAAYERTLRHEPTKFDRYVQGLSGGAVEADETLLSEQELAGARLFMDASRTQCLQCHNGPRLTNGDFHNIGTGNTSGPNLDFGREIGLRAVLMDEFNCLGPYSDAGPRQCVDLIYLNRDSHLPLRGAFKVPTLRGLRLTAPYFHDGRFATLREVLHYYNQPPPVESVGPHELRPMDLDDDELQQLESFLLTLSD